jgi:hypothetical protein
MLTASLITLVTLLERLLASGTLTMAFISPLQKGADNAWGLLKD